MPSCLCTIGRIVGMNNHVIHFAIQVDGSFTTGIKDKLIVFRGYNLIFQNVFAGLKLFLIHGMLLAGNAPYSSGRKPGGGDFFILLYLQNMAYKLIVIFCFS